MRMEFTLGAKANCTDGFCGVVSRTIVDPAAGTITHLVVEPRHEKGAGRLVPVELVDVMAGDIMLRCTLAEFSGLAPAEEVELVEDRDFEGGGGPPLMVSHSAPMGETEVGRHAHVHAVDGEIGQVEGFMVNRADHAVTHILLKEGHLGGRKQVAIPVSAITSVADGIRLSITKKQVEDLPPFPDAEGSAPLRPGDLLFPSAANVAGRRALSTAGAATPASAAIAVCCCHCLLK
jgi:sporulation protein YlmC with PRC-barrel domain